MFCPKCGNSIPDGVRFCPKCGNAIGKATSIKPKIESRDDSSKYSSHQPSSAKKTGYLLREDGVCPNCGSHNCEIQVQQNVTSSGSNYSCCNGGLGAICMGPYGLLCGLCGTGNKTTTTHRSVWVCKNCGNQFPTKKDLFANFVASVAMLNLLFGLFLGGGVLILILVPPIGLIFIGLMLIVECLNYITHKKAMGSWLECTEEEIANGPLPKLNLKFYRAAKPLCAILARTPTKGDVVSGVLTEEQLKTYQTTNLVSTGIGIALAIVLVAIL